MGTNIFGQVVFPTGSGATLVTAVTEVIGDNIAVIFSVLGFMVGLYLIRRWLGSGLKGRA